MSINEHNYEYFFLMYVDDELNAAERQTVEAFVIAHPALRTELELLKETVLPNGEMKMDKKGLYKAATVEAMPGNELMLYLDNELDLTDRQQFDKQLETNKAMQAELATWQKTKLDTDELVPFPNKAILYRQEKSRLVNMRIIKWAVAAAFIGAGFFAGINLLKRQDAVVSQVAVQQGSKVTPPTNNAVKHNQPLAAETAAVRVQQPSSAPALASVKIERSAKVPTAKTVSIQTKNSNDAIAGIATNAPTDRQIFKNAIQQETDILEPMQSSARIIKSTTVNKTELVANLTTKEKPSYAKLVSNNNENEREVYTRNALLNDGEGDNHIFLMEEETIAHSKAGAFFKKLKRTVARTANIKAGNSLKIAGFEFAVK